MSATSAYGLVALTVILILVTFVSLLCKEFRRNLRKDSLPQTGDIVEIHDEDGALTWPVKAGYVGRRYRDKMWVHWTDGSTTFEHVTGFEQLEEERRNGERVFWRPKDWTREIESETRT